jgi:hypothetical protein
MPGIRSKTGKAMIIKAIVTSEIAGSGSLLALYQILHKERVKQVSIDCNKKIYFLPFVTIEF